MRTLLLAFLLCTSALFAKPYQVLVSIAPQKYLIEEIAGKTVEVELLVPEEMSSHSYEPTIKQIIQAKEADVWFCIGENFERKLYESFGAALPIVDAREDLPLLYSACKECSSCRFDPHIWLSCPLLVRQVQQIADTLSKALPENRELYQENARRLIQRVDKVDQKIKTLLQGREGQAILVSHPAFGYFCHDYKLTQMAIEVGGKEPSPKQLTTLIKQAKERRVATIFTQPQHPLRSALRLQEALGIKRHQINPYKEDVLANLESIAEAFASHG